MKPALFRALCGALLLLAAPALAQGGTLFGSVVDTVTKKALLDVRVVATSPELKAEQVTFTDRNGNYLIAQLPPGIYSLRFEKESYKPYLKKDLQLRPGGTARVNVELLPQSASDTPPVSTAPGADKGSEQGTLTVEAPGHSQDPARAFQSVAPLAPPLRTEAEGVARYLPPAFPYVMEPGNREGAPPAWALRQLSVLGPASDSQYLYRAPERGPRSEAAAPGANGVNPTIDTEEDRFSVFFVGVDTAPYGVARDYLKRDVLPDARTVWAEAFINAFDYGDTGDTNGPFLIDVEGFPSPSRKGYHVVRITLRSLAALTDVDVQVEFDRQSVARYRLVGYERAAPAPESLDEHEEQLTPLPAGKAITAIYEMKLTGPAIAFGTLRIHYEQDGSKSWRRVQKLLPSSLLRSSYARAAPGTRLAYVAAAFAEKLRGSFWTRTLDWARLYSLWDDVGEPLRGRPDVVELGALIRKAQALDTRKERVPAGTAMDFDNVPDAAD